METKQYKYYAFISYRGADVKWAKWFVKKADNYLLPTVTPDDVEAGYHAPSRLKDDDKYLYPVFRDRDNLMSGKLLDQILAAIDVSRKIVVLCTPEAAKSGSWMDDELRHIIDEKRVGDIIPLVVEGRIYSIEEYEAAGRSIDDPFPDDSNPYVLRQYMKEHRNHAAINYIEFVEQGIHNPERAFIKCVASIIDMPFEDLWDRFGKEQKRKKRIRRISIAAAVAATAIVGLGTWMYNQPVDVQIGFNETTVHNENLPAIKDAIVVLTLDNETKRDTVSSLDHLALFTNIPREALGKEARIAITCDQCWLTTDTTLTLSKNMTLNIARDPHPYGDIQFMLWNPNTERAYPGVTVTISGHSATADAEGYVRYTMPLAEQHSYYIIKAPMPLENDTLYMPATESAVIIVK